MESHQTHTDYDLGQKICRELRSGNSSAILELYHKYGRFLAAFTRYRLFDDDPHGVENVLSNFWLELINARAICKYNGRASLRTYLTVILNRRIIDANRKFERNRNSSPLKTKNENSEDDLHYDQQTPEKQLIIKEQHRLIQKALLKLSDTCPRDANLIRMNLEGLSYEQMAQRELNGVKDADELKRRIDAIKKQFTRKETGSMAKFRSVLDNYLDKNDLNHKDLLT
ncbi:MAG: sigma-70 family RNA polymerase sigma factor [Desulfobacterales bacterium]|jgi:RNA polymerase sigma-70 factor (ECF subfamily)